MPLSKIPLLQAGLVSALLLAATAQAGTLEIQLGNLRPGGAVRVSVFGDANSWAHDGKPVAARAFIARDFTCSLRIDGLPAGRYAVRAQQDGADRPGDIGSLALAVSRHGSSGGNNAHAAPSFNDAAVEVRDEDPRITLHLFADSNY